jgi:hypothetical protein
MAEYLRAEGFSDDESAEIVRNAAAQRSATVADAGAGATAASASGAASGVSSTSVAAVAAPNLACDRGAVARLLSDLSQHTLSPSGGLPALLLQLHEWLAHASSPPAPPGAARGVHPVAASPASVEAPPPSVEAHSGAGGSGGSSSRAAAAAVVAATLLRCDTCAQRTAAAKLLLSMLLCGRSVDAAVFLLAAKSQARTLEAVLNTALRDRLAGHPACANHLRWAILYAVDAARSGSGAGSGGSEEAGAETEECGGGGAGGGGDGVGRRWADRALLLKALIVGGQMEAGAGVLQQLYDTMSAGDLLEASAIIAQAGRPCDVRPLLKTVCGPGHGVRFAAACPELPRMVNSLARRRQQVRVHADSCMTRN